MKIAQIGIGKWGKNHLRIMKELERDGHIDSISVVDVDERALEEAKTKYDIEGTTDYREILEDVDAVTIVTPADSHCEIAKDALKAGKDVFIEKPMTNTSKEAKELLDLTSENNSILMVGHIFRYNPAVWKLKEEIDSFKRVNYIFTRFMGLREPRTDSGAMYTYAVHDIDLLCYLLNEKFPLEVNAINGYFYNKDLEDSSLITLKFPNNVLGHIMVNWVTPGKFRDILAVGVNKSVYIDRLSQTMEIRTKDVTTNPSITFQEPLKLELRSFTEHVKKRSRPEADAFSGYRTILTLEKAMESARIGKTVPLEEEV